MSSVKRSVFLSFLFASWILSVAAPLHAQVGRHQGMTEPNIADEKELMRLPHVNPALAKDIVERRPFANMMDLHKFLSQSLDSKQLNELYTKMFLQINLNTATREEIMLVPGTGNRMVREFLSIGPTRPSFSFAKRLVSMSTTKKLPGWSSMCSRQLT
jgi:predicted DNA-binding helix-hairpin-helix protein